MNGYANSANILFGTGGKPDNRPFRKQSEGSETKTAMTECYGL